jgi:hypothetical protein
MLGNGQSLRKGFLAVTAEEFVVGHTDLHRAEKGDGRILDHLAAGSTWGKVPGSRIFWEIWVADSARFSGLELA